MQQQPATALAFVNDYHPGVPFQVISRIQQPTVNQILGYVDPAQQDGQAVVDPTDYDGYVYNYTQCGPGNYNLVFVRDGTLQQGQTYSFATDATIFSNSQQLVEASIQTGGGGGQADGNVTEENVTEDNVTGDNATDGNVTDGNVTDGNATDGNATDGNVTGDGNVTDGNVTDGNVTGGNATGGNQTDDVNVTINATNQTGG